MLRDINEAMMKSLEDIRPKPRAIPKAISRTERRKAFMLRQRKARRHNSRMLTERTSPKAISGISMKPLCAKEIVEKVTITETRIAQRKITIPNFISPGNAESAERKTSMQTKKRSTALAMYTAQ